MRWVHQKDARGCLVASMAMATGHAYGDVHHWLTERGLSFGDNGGMTHHDVQAYLGLHGFVYDLRYRWVGANVAREIWPCSPFAPVHIVGVNGGHHGVAMNADGVIFDPLDSAPRTVADYAEVGWMLGIWRVLDNGNVFADLVRQRLDRWWPALVKAGRLHGYALTLHGSCARDIDVVAVPWSGEVSSPQALVEALRDACQGYIRDDPTAEPWDYTRRAPEPKPHGRLAWSLYPGDGLTYFDISVFTPADSPVHRAVIEKARREGYAAALSDRVTAGGAR